MSFALFLANEEWRTGTNFTAVHSSSKLEHGRNTQMLENTEILLKEKWKKNAINNNNIPDINETKRSVEIRGQTEKRITEFLHRLLDVRPRTEVREDKPRLKIKKLFASGFGAVLNGILFVFFSCIFTLLFAMSF